ncbi:helix-turn-helix domain-containing protein [Clostridium formicaceticum]|uniref:HTH-type transcriptional regulator SinR n=1 Tax=Clostridium formicaceticum TaxID=1497 RepID=A0AAC9RK45_9CLOT|nr:helix-turn-helix transcriptional regulator [Clostridium formicaceticum]AOY76659.1 hypothetical protein BJL90_12755 [Clostridium formicaceticum]ARE87084.1 HTH-type transcriptional regulator SinR [Clostridium formicaceticum]
MQIGQRIKKIRNSLGLTQSQLASRANISRSYLGDVENGRYNPSLNMLENIAEVLNTSVDYLLAKSVSCLIESRLKELNMSLEELAEKTNLPLMYLKTLDDKTPDDKDYEIINLIAQTLKMHPKPLRIALARQEQPDPENKNNNNGVNETIELKGVDNILANMLDDDKILTLAAHRAGHEGPLSEEEIEKIKLAIRIALANNNTKK